MTIGKVLGYKTGTFNDSLLSSYHPRLSKPIRRAMITFMISLVPA
jgi:hypothetical protein